MSIKGNNYEIVEKTHLLASREPAKDFDKTTNGIKVLSYSLGVGRSTRNIFFKKNLNNTTACLVNNIPFFLDENSLMQLFQDVIDTSTIKRIKIQKITTNEGGREGNQSGIINFCSEEKCTKFLNELDEIVTIPAQQFIEQKYSTPFGYKKHMEQYNTQFVRTEELGHFIKALLHDRKFLEKEKPSKKRKIEPDEDGWVLVRKNDKHSFSTKINYANRK